MKVKVVGFDTSTMVSVLLLKGMPSADSYSSNSSSRKSTASFSGGGFLLNKKKTVVKERSESTMDEESDTADSFQRR